MSVISNTTVLSNFAAIDALDNLRELFEEIYLSRWLERIVESGFHSQSQTFRP